MSQNPKVLPVSNAANIQSSFFPLSKVIKQTFKTTNNKNHNDSAFVKQLTNRMPVNNSLCWLFNAC